MSTLIVTNLPEHLCGALNARARKHHRSLDEEVFSVIKQAIYSSDAQSLAQDILTSVQPLSLHDLELAMSDNQYSRVNSLIRIEEAMYELRGERIDPRG